MDIAPYCNICGGPFYCSNFIKGSTVPDDETDYWDDDCDCSRAGDDEEQFYDAHEESGQIGDDQPHEEEHREYCSSRRGYNGRVISRNQMWWLNNARMVCEQTPWLLAMDEEEASDPCVVTPVGKVSEDNNLFIPDLGQVEQGLQPHQDGFLFHDTCWKIMREAYNHIKPNKMPLDLRELHFTMSAMYDKYSHSIDWRGEKYGGAEKFQGEYWEPFPGCEWYVMDPFNDLNLSRIVSQSTDPSKPDTFDFFPANWRGSTSHSPDNLDPFPMDIRLMIFELLPSPSALNLLLASPSFRDMAIGLPRRFWYSRLSWGAPWANGTSLYEDIHQQTATAQYKQLFDRLRCASSVPGDSSSPQIDHLGLRNKRRIFNNCTRILNKVEQHLSQVRTQAGSVTRAITKLSSRRVVTIGEEDFSNPFRVFSDAYFLPSLTRRGQLKAVTVHYKTEGVEYEWDRCIIGIEFSLHDQDATRMFGHKSKSTDTVAIDRDTIITGLAISLGMFMDIPLEDGKDEDSTIQGLGFFTKDSPAQPKYTVGQFSRHDLVHVLYAEPGKQIIGITGEFDAGRLIAPEFGFGLAPKRQRKSQKIRKFGMIMADMNNLEQGTVQEGISLSHLTRWAADYPPPDYSVGNRHGIDLRSAFDCSPPILTTPVSFLDLNGRQIKSIQANFSSEDSWGPEVICGLFFTFADGKTRHIGYDHKMTTSKMLGLDMLMPGGSPGMSPMGMSDMGDSDEPSSQPITFNFDFEKKERIVGVRFHSERSPVRFGSPGLQGIEFVTNLDRKLSVGYNGMHDDDYGEITSCPEPLSGRELVGLQFGIRPCVIESAGPLYK